MDKLWMVLPGAAMAGLGAVLCAMGYRQVRFQAMTVGVCVFAAAGAAAGAALGYPAFAAGLCGAGAILGYTLHGLLFRAYVGLAAAMGGAALGLLLCVVCHYSNPLLLCGAAAAGSAVIALLDARIMTIGWTSAAGAALVTHGLLRSTPELLQVPPVQLAWTLAAIFAVLFGTGFAFQMRTTTEKQNASTEIAPAPQPSHGV
jgi:hypothetical protein